ncbi:hypothetical protein Q5R05_03200 [Leuconostoc carnosum]|uniref:hypothetical protein n=1 Tax=Leuconostoc TaxID=1243 RepID=UPI00272ED926|nr:MULTISPECIES: hypothetical protein [Leuconostoc]MDV8936250.1 hypothetical protein [Leuconostoc sp.]WLC98389.1 hypothetical protein Q5R05_03200 [Leuconostoc carnosum]
MKSTIFFTITYWDDSVAFLLSKLQAVVEKYDEIIIAADVSKGDIIIPETNLEVISYSQDELEIFGLYDKSHYKTLWKNSDFTMYYLSHQVVSDYYIQIEADVLVSKSTILQLMSGIDQGLDYIFLDTWLAEKKQGLWYWSDTYTDNKKLDYVEPFVGVDKQIWAVSKKVIDEVLLPARRAQSKLTLDGIKIPNDEFFLGMTLVKSTKLQGQNLFYQVPHLNIKWNDSKYFGDFITQTDDIFVHPVRSAVAAISSLIEKNGITKSDLIKENSYLKTHLLINIRKEQLDWTLTENQLVTLSQNTGVSIDNINKIFLDYL